MDNSIIDLRKIKKPAHSPLVVSQSNPPPVTVVSATPPPPPPQRGMAAPSAPLAAREAPKLPPRPSRKMELPWWTPYVVGAVIMIVLIVVGHYIYKNVWSRSPFGPTPGDVSATSTVQKAPSELTEADILGRVGALMLLPTDESPTLAKVSDPTALSQQAFFKNAKMGDIVVMYAKNSKAILYDPVTDKILEVAPIVTGSATSTASTGPKKP